MKSEILVNKSHNSQNFSSNEESPETDESKDSIDFNEKLSFFNEIQVNDSNNEQKKGILKIIDDKLINKNGENNFIEFNINNIIYIYYKYYLINNNININNNYKTEVEEKKEDTLIQMDELSSSLSELSDSLDSESFDLE